MSSFKQMKTAAKRGLAMVLTIALALSFATMLTVSAANTWELTYDLNAPSGADTSGVTLPTAQTGISDIVASAAVGVPTGEPTAADGVYVFIGWNTQSDGNGTWYFDTNVVPAQADGTVFKLYAQWIFEPYEEHFLYITGYPDGTVRPQGNLTRGEAVWVFYRQSIEQGKFTAADAVTANSYSDVNAGQWYNTAISSAKKMGYFAGWAADGASAFNPDTPITRAELAVIAANFAKAAPEAPDADNALPVFTDIADHWAKSYIEYAARKGYFVGYGDGTFRPDSQITRAEFMSVVNTASGHVVENDSFMLPNMKTWPDNADKTAWYYTAVQVATNSYLAARTNKPVANRPFNYEKWISIIDYPFTIPG
ncbi:MAG: S-layer homology domain-containing protein [Oscillospiraceae bacterium]|jgi:hypothetical protein|nr:S-layer homology domain-containing protein [Oscillospiraceae bacterium]